MPPVAPVHGRGREELCAPAASRCLHLAGELRLAAAPPRLLLFRPQVKPSVRPTTSPKHLPAASPAFLAALRSFASGDIPPAQFQDIVDQVIVGGPKLVLYDNAEPDVVFAGALEAAFCLDMVLDEGPSQDLAEARSLATALACVLGDSVESDPALGHLIELARWKDANAERIRAFVRGEFDRAGFERFVSRRSWPNELQHVVAGLDNQQLLALADSLVGNDWARVRVILAAA